MKSMATKLSSSELAVFEAFVTNARTGLKRPQIQIASGIPNMTVRRIIKRFQNEGIVVNVGKAPGSKAELFRLNAADREVVEITRSLLDYSVRMNKIETAKFNHEAAKARAEPTEVLESSSTMTFPNKPALGLVIPKKRTFSVP
jgi:hypothetical protein